MNGHGTNKSSRIDTIYREIRSKILTDSLRPGQKLSETTLSKEYGCSRTPIREILQRLRNDGLIIIKPKSGTYVKNETSQDYVNLMQVRASLEQLAFTLAIEKSNDSELDRLVRLKKQMDELVKVEPVDMMKFAQLHHNFHLRIVHMSGNDLLIQLFERLNLRSSHMFYQMMDRKLGAVTQEEHQVIIDYLENGDPKGAEFIKEHLYRKISRYLSQQAP